MGIFKYDDFSSPQDVNDDPHRRECIFCQTLMHNVNIDNIFGPIKYSLILEVQEETKKIYKELHNIEDGYLNLQLDTIDEYQWLSYCKSCGWWKVMKQVDVCAEIWQIWDMFFGICGTLKSLDINDAHQPIDEISKYLVAKYSGRFVVNPKLFEDVVASVFRNLGYHTRVTGYSNDGGIDVILAGGNDLIGIQVKRYSNKIKVEQIRAFAGALLLSGYKKGIFVTTSDFQPAAVKAAKEYSAKTLPILLMNADRFYDALKISQKPEIDLESIIESVKNKRPQLIEYGMSYPRNSL